uniref:VWFA domain-containing protein n=1 Tax=Panagrolaimus davidi TaxID=227884 RepID=A0A914PN80_9BILA
MVTKHLTSGYYESEKDFRAMEEGKCAHGGLTDNYGGGGPTVGGINKDSATVIMSPHYYLHHTAANLSVKATIKYFEDIRTALNDERLFGKLIGIEISETSSKMVSSKAFVIDTTGSMINSIESIKTFVEKLVKKNSNETLKYFLTPFNDPEFGPVKTFNSPEQMTAAVKELEAKGGGTLSEKMYAALMETARKVPESTAIYVFTDSVSKNCRLLPSIMRIAAKKNLQINFFLPGITKKPRMRRSRSSSSNSGLNKCESEESIEDFRKLALATDGQFVVASGESLQKAAETLTDSNWQRLKMFSNINTPFNETIEFDKSVKEVEISMNAGTSGNLNTVRVDIVDENGTNAVTGENILISNAYSKVFRFNTTDGSPLTILIDGNNQTIEQIDIKIKSDISPNVMITDSDSKKSVRGALKPGQKYDITITCASCSDISKIVIARCGDNTPIMPAKTPEKCGRVNRWCVKDIQLPPVSGDNQFCISYAGNFKNDDITFERIAQQKLTTSALNLNTTFSTETESPNDPGEVYPNDNITINYSIENLGESDDEIILKVTSSQNLPMNYFKDPIKIGKGKKALGNIYITANAPVGSIVDIEICATSKSDPSQHSSDDYTVFITDPNADLDAPECTVDYSTAISCPKNPKHCKNSTYVVLISFKDVDSGVSTVNYPRGQWQIAERNLFHSSYAINHTFYAMGVHSCCDDVEFNVMDKEHLIGQCTLEPYQKSLPTAAMTSSSSSPPSMIRISFFAVIVFVLSFDLRV